MAFRTGALDSRSFSELGTRTLGLKLLPNPNLLQACDQKRQILKEVIFSALAAFSQIVLGAPHQDSGLKRGNELTGTSEMLL